MKTHYVFANKIKKLPEVLIYNKPKSSFYTMMATKKPREVGFMWALPSKFKGEKSFEIPIFKKTPIELCFAITSQKAAFVVVIIGVSVVAQRRFFWS